MDVILYICIYKLYAFVEVCCTLIKIGIQWMGKFNEQEKKSGQSEKTAHSQFLNI